MSNIGIIAEFNPYHNGHKYLCREAREISGADSIISLMSGNFVQRAVPAMADKYSRAEAATMSEVDITFELPVIFATASSRDFASGAVNILNATGQIDYLAFGVETDDYELFDEVSDILANEPEEYKKLLSDYLSKGLSFPAASERAIVSILGSRNTASMNMPNNILAISYLTALKKTGSDIKPIIIKRRDEGYHNKELTGKYSSATAIRNAINNSEVFKDYIPKGTDQPYYEYTLRPLPHKSWLTPFITSRIIYDRNLPRNISQLENTLDITPEILNRLRKAPLPIKFVELQDYLKTKNITMSRVNRVLLHMVLGINNNDRVLSQNGDSFYLNLLAFKESKTQLIKEIDKSDKIEIINKKSSYNPDTEKCTRMWQLDKLATDLYNQLIYDNSNIRLHSELTCTPKKIK